MPSPRAENPQPKSAAARRPMAHRLEHLFPARPSCVGPPKSRGKDSRACSLDHHARKATKKATTSLGLPCVNARDRLPCLDFCFLLRSATQQLLPPMM
ncbi:hypothetical protein GUJ93_ZPchr0006g41463 [Zizania palustris]|uniref:Uncharacterized protein n=1 Tax=Zizania palustris TaxID=103762 RepID=A0A8J5S638_ZIZPA|nr:hypothetical protein GUJ93_ZPchr0006g41463 [Zizania palustris]